MKSCKRKDKEILRKHENSEKMQLSKYKDKDFNVFYCQTFPEDIGTIFQFYISPQHYIFWLKLFLIGTRNWFHMYVTSVMIFVCLYSVKILIQKNRSDKKLQVGAGEIFFRWTNVVVWWKWQYVDLQIVVMQIKGLCRLRGYVD